MTRPNTGCVRNARLWHKHAVSFAGRRLPLEMNHQLPGTKLVAYAQALLLTGVSEMVGQVLKWPLAGDDRLDKEPERGKHGEPAVFLISFTLSSANFSGSSASPSASKLPPGYNTTGRPPHPAVHRPPCTPPRPPSRQPAGDALHCIINLSEQNPNALGESLGSD